MNVTIIQNIFRYQAEAAMEFSFVKHLTVTSYFT
jgi:hypothetical protein